MKLREMLERLQYSGELVQIKKPVSSEYEVASIINQLDEKPVLFHNVSGSQYAVVAGMCSTRELLAASLGTTKERLMPLLARAIKRPKAPEVVAHGQCQEVVEESVNLDALPIPKHFPKDGGAYVSAAIAIIKDPETGRNASFHRLMKIGKDRFAIRLVEGRQTHTTYTKLLKRGEELEVAFCIGNSAAVMLSAAISGPSGLDELSIANALEETKLVKCKTKDLEVPADSEIILEGRITSEQADEGPFVDLTETMDIVRKQPVVVIDKITHRRDAIFQTLLPGKREHKLLMGMPREPTIFNEVNKVCKCTNVALTMGGCSWLHAVVQIRKRSESDPRKAIEAAFEGHPSLKHCVIVDEDIDPTDPVQVEWAIATRFRAGKKARKLFIMEDQPSSSLDPMADKPPGKKATTTKVGIDATIPLKDPKRPKQKFLRVEYKKVELKEFL